MNDLVQRLRENNAWTGDDGLQANLRLDAANEIERLRDELADTDALWRQEAEALKEANLRLSKAQNVPTKVWLWRNHVDGRPEYWAFDNPFPIHLDNDDPQTLGEPCGYALVKASRNGRPEVSEEEVLRNVRIASERRERERGEYAGRLKAEWQLFKAGFFKHTDHDVPNDCYVITGRAMSQLIGDVDRVAEADAVHAQFHVTPLTIDVDKDCQRYRWLREQIKDEKRRVIAQALFWNHNSRRQLDVAIDELREGSDDKGIRNLAVGGAQLAQTGGDSGGMPFSVGRIRPDKAATPSTDLTEKRLALLEEVERIVNAYVEDYEWTDGDNGYHAPSEEESILIADAIAGLHADDAFVAAWDAWRALCRPDAVLKKGVES